MFYNECHKLKKIFPSSPTSYQWSSMAIGNNHQSIFVLIVGDQSPWPSAINCLDRHDQLSSLFTGNRLDRQRPTVVIVNDRLLWLLTIDYQDGRRPNLMILYNHFLWFSTTDQQLLPSAIDLIIDKWPIVVAIGDQPIVLIIVNWWIVVPSSIDHCDCLLLMHGCRW